MYMREREVHKAARGSPDLPTCQIQMTKSKLSNMAGLSRNQSV